MHYFLLEPTVAQSIKHVYFSIVETLPIKNPFGAPVYYKDTVTSTMDEARLLLSGKTGTVIAADEQSAARGRSGRPWKMNRGENLSFTIMLLFPGIEAIPPALTLRTGLAAAYAIEDFITADCAAFISESHNTQHELSNQPAGRVLVKWPNDVMLLDRTGQGRKSVGILTEAEGGNVYIGIGVNIAQRNFSPELAQKACSIGQVLSEENGFNELIAEQLSKKLMEKRFALLEKILSYLYNELNNTAGEPGLQKRLEQKLYMKDRRVRFVPGPPEEQSRKPLSVIEGTLLGIGQNGEIKIVDDAGVLHSFVTGELSKTPI